MVIGVVQPPKVVKGETVIRTAEHSYFSRLTDSDTFQRVALVETQRRGVETAAAVGFVTDGSEWLQKFADHHRVDAVRILDFPHAGEHLAPVGQVRFGEGSAEAQSWLKTQLHTLKHDGPTAVVAEVVRLVAAQPETPDLAGHLAYLEKRTAHMQYPTFLAAGWPIGDGAVESGNKLVVEARLKGSGMHWARPHVDPMLALRISSAAIAGTRPGPRSCARCASRRSNAGPNGGINGARRITAQRRPWPAPHPAPGHSSHLRPQPRSARRQCGQPAHRLLRRNPASPGARRPTIPGGACLSVGRVSSRQPNIPMQNLEPHPQPGLNSH